MHAAKPSNFARFESYTCTLFHNIFQNSELICGAGQILWMVFKFL